MCQSGIMVDKSVIGIPVRQLNSMRFVVTKNNLRCVKLNDGFEMRYGSHQNFEHKTTAFFDHRDPEMIKWIGERKWND
jgi:hypothetical protein